MLSDLEQDKTPSQASGVSCVKRGRTTKKEKSGFFFQTKVRPLRISNLFLKVTMSSLNPNMEPSKKCKRNQGERQDHLG